MCELYDRTERRGLVFAHQVCIWFNMNHKQPYPCSGLGQFEAESERPHTQQLPTVRVCFWPRLNWLSPLNLIQSHMLSACPAIGTLLNHKSPKRKHLTFCYNHSLLRRTHKCKHRQKQWYQFQSSNTLQNMSGGWKRMWHFKVCAVAWQLNNKKKKGW